MSGVGLACVSEGCGEAALVGRAGPEGVAGAGLLVNLGCGMFNFPLLPSQSLMSCSIILIQHPTKAYLYLKWVIFFSLPNSYLE